MRLKHPAWCVVAAACLPGCLFATADPSIEQITTQVESITQRVDRLESAHGLGGTAARVSTSAVLYTAGSGAAGAAGVDGGLSGGGVPVFSWWGSLSKLARGVTNSLTGWVEIPKRVQETTTASGAGLGFTLGLLRGVGHGFIRTVGGIYEVVTFPFPAPPGYRPVTQPPYVFTCEDARPR